VIGFNHVSSELKALDVQRGAGATMMRQASLEQIEKNPELQAYAQQVGQSVFGDNCATCHGIGGTGGTGYPNLRDDVWIWGGTLQDIQHTLQVGVRADHAQTRMSQMPAFGRDELLPPAAISDMTEYVVKLSGRPADTAAVARAAPVFATQCVACHGADGRGIQALGAPNLTDADWLYGSDREAISGQIYAGRGGVMPAWGGRLSPETIKALTVYVHANAGGQ